MASIPPVKVPVIGELVNGKLKCCSCTDRALGSGESVADGDIADAFTIAPLAQVFNVGGQQVIGVTALPVCKPCRAVQLGKPSNNGRLVVS